MFANLVNEEILFIKYVVTKLLYYMTEISQCWFFEGFFLYFIII